MEVVIQNYKQTDVGLIPSDWNVMSVGEIFWFKNGLNKEKKFFGKGTPIVNYMDVYKYRGLTTENINGKVTVSKQELKNYSVQKGDVFFTRTSETIEEIGIASTIIDDVKETVFSGFVLRARPKNDLLINKYKKYCFSTESSRKQITSKASYTTRALTSGRLLSQIKILVPPTKKEQDAIATALSDSENYITHLEKLIEKKRLIKQGAMQKLLKAKENWIFKQIKEFTDVVSGGTPNTSIKEYWDGEIRWMNSGELSLKKVFEVENRITEKGVKFSATKLIPKNCILVGLAGQGKTRGTVAINKVELCTNQSIASILPCAEVSYDFLFYNLDSRYDELRGLSTGDGGRGGLNLSIIKNLDVALPPTLEEQFNIASILSDMDAEIELLENQLSKAQSIKQGMMQQLLTGTIRLV